MAVFFTGRNSENQARKLVAKLKKFEGDIPVSFEKKLLKVDNEVLSIIIKEHFDEFSPEVKAKFKIIIDNSGYVEYLFSEVKSGEEKRVVNAVEIIGLLKLKKGFWHVVDCLKDRRDSVNLEAARALIHMQDARVIRYLVDELVSGKSSILPARMGQVLVEMASQAVHPLMEVFWKLQPKNQIQVLDIFAEMNDKRLLPLLQEAVINAEPPVRARAAAVLGDFGGESSLTYLERAKEDSNTAVRESAKIALKQIAAAREGGLK